MCTGLDEALRTFASVFAAGCCCALGNSFASTVSPAVVSAVLAVVFGAEETSIAESHKISFETNATIRLVVAAVRAIIARMGRRSGRGLRSWLSRR